MTQTFSRELQLQPGEDMDLAAHALAAQLLADVDASGLRPTAPPDPIPREQWYDEHGFVRVRAVRMYRDGPQPQWNLVAEVWIVMPSERDL